MCNQLQADPAHRETFGREGGQIVYQSAADIEGDDDSWHWLWRKGTWLFFLFTIHVLYIQKATI